MGGKAFSQNQIRQIENFIVEHPQWNNAEIGKHLSISASAVKRYRQKLGIPGWEKAVSAETKMAITTFVSQNPMASNREISEYFALSEVTIRRVRRGLNLGKPLKKSQPVRQAKVKKPKAGRQSIVATVRLDPAKWAELQLLANKLGISRNKLVVDELERQLKEWMATPAASSCPALGLEEIGAI